MAIEDENKVRIVQAGILPLLVKMLSSEDVTVLTEATRALWSLAFKCQDSINEEPRCREGIGLRFVFFSCRLYNLPGNLPGAAAPVPQDPQKHVRP